MALCNTIDRVLYCALFTRALFTRKVEDESEKRDLWYGWGKTKVDKIVGLQGSG